MIKVRFAPSPTGYLHIGGARTALFNWMYAKSQNGKFVLRIEDTDLNRSGPEFVDEILESMKWLGFDWDELYYQSKRFDLYRDYAKNLLKEGKAYEDGPAIILKMPQREVKLYDIIRGEITFDTSTIKDQVLIKSDGSPTYSFACVLDDALMEITHVIRGEDHISNTPKQIVMYEELGFKVPKFAHLPLIMGEDGGRLSKRTGAVAVSDYKKMGFLPESVVNYLMLLGWSPGNNQEIISMNNAVKSFSIKKINKTAAVFSLDKLTWVNQEYIKNKDPQDVLDAVTLFMKEKGINTEIFDKDFLLKTVKLFQKRIPTLEDFLVRTEFLFKEDYQVDQVAITEEITPNAKKYFACLLDKLKTLTEFTVATTEDAFKKVLEDLGIKSSELVHPVRVALTGSTVGVGLFEIMELLGQERTCCRLRKYVD